MIKKVVIIVMLVISIAGCLYPGPFRGHGGGYYGSSGGHRR